LWELELGEAFASRQLESGLQIVDAVAARDIFPVSRSREANEPAGTTTDSSNMRENQEADMGS